MNVRLFQAIQLNVVILYIYLPVKNKNSNRSGVGNVTPAQAGVQPQKILDSRFRGNDKRGYAGKSWTVTFVLLDISTITMYKDAVW